MIIVADITILFSDLVSLIVPLQTWNVKYYKYAIIKNGLKSLLVLRVSYCAFLFDGLIVLHEKCVGSVSASTSGHANTYIPQNQRNTICHRQKDVFIQDFQYDEQGVSKLMAQ